MTSPNPSGKWTLAALAPLLGAELVGDGALEVTCLSHPMLLFTAQELAIVLEPDSLKLVANTPAKAALVPEQLPVPEGLLQGYLKVSRPKVALAILLNIFNRPVHHKVGVHPSAVVEPTAKLGENVSIGPLAYVGEHAVIGDNTIINPHVTVEAEARVGCDVLLHSGVRIGERVIIGNRVIIHHNASIGADGFSFVTPKEGSIESARANNGRIEAENSDIIRINSVGTVVIEDDVEIGACSTVDRSNIGATLIKKGTKLDDMVMIGHNNIIGENCMFAGQSGVAGSCEVGNRVVVAGQVGIKDHLKVGDDSIIMAKSGVMWDVEPKSILGGMPAVTYRDYMRNVSHINHLHKLNKEVKTLRTQLAALQAASAHQQPDVTLQPEPEALPEALKI